MSDPSVWLLEKEASAVLKVDELILELLRESGRLKPGIHWRSSNNPEQLPWKPKVFYHISRCREVIQKSVDMDDFYNQIAA